MAVHYMTINQVAEHIGLSFHTVKKYQSEGRLPEPDAILGRGCAAKYGWLEETIDQWQENRPGRWKKRGDILA